MPRIDNTSRFAGALAIAACGFALNAFVACSDDEGSGGAGGGGGAISEPAGGTSSGPTPEGCADTPFGPVEAACTALCDSLEDKGCSWAESWVPSSTFEPKLFSLYVSGSASRAFDSAKCQSSCTAIPTSGGGEACNVQRAAYINCLDQKGTCETEGDYVYLRAEACSPERAALVECGSDCELIPVCDPSTCNGSDNVGEVFCNYGCVDGYCTQMCN